jgi:hypothetical protein
VARALARVGRPAEVREWVHAVRLQAAPEWGLVARPAAAPEWGLAARPRGGPELVREVPPLVVAGLDLAARPRGARGSVLWGSARCYWRSPRP